jgi:hypothetical protein
MACRTCRDRKVRCDGAQPACEKCQRANEPCVYLPASRQSKADIALTIESLQERLGRELVDLGWHSLTKLERTEAKLQEQGRTSPTRSNSAQPENSGVEAGSASSAPLSSATLPTNAMDSLLGYAQEPAFDSDTSSPATGFGDLGTPDMLDLLSPGLLMSPMYPRSMFPNDTDFFEHFPTIATQIPHQKRPHGLRPSPGQLRPFPSLRDLRAQSGSTGQHQQPASMPSQHRLIDISNLVEELGSFVSTLLVAHADVAGIAAALADYLSWASKQPDPSSILCTLEARAREIADIGASHSRPCLAQLARALGDTEGAVKLKEVEAILQSRLTELSRFFQDSYEIGHALSDQQDV